MAADETQHCRGTRAQRTPATRRDRSGCRPGAQRGACRTLYQIRVGPAVAMRIILDTNIIVSALISEHGVPAQLLNAWTDRAFSLVTSTTQITELIEVT